MFASRRKDAFEVKHSNQAKKCFEHVQTAQSDQEIILCICKVSSEPLLSIDTFSRIQWFS